MEIGIFSQQKSFLSGGMNLTANLARRMLKAHTDLGADTTTQLADINIQLTPLSRAIDIELTYELDKKLTSQRREVYTNIHPHTGVLLQPGGRILREVGRSALCRGSRGRHLHQNLPKRR